MAPHLYPYIRRATNIGFFLIAALIAGQILTSLIGWGLDYRLRRLNPDQVFEYVAVEYIETTPDGLLMASTAAWYRPVDGIEWLDRLECPPSEGDGRGGSTWSSQIFNSAEREPISLRTVEWVYAESYPTDRRRCRMVSTITAEHRGRVFTQRITSAPFTPGDNQ